jgi:hypothetical protein
MVGIVLNLVLYLLAGFLDELLSVYEILLYSVLCLVLGPHILLNVCIVEVFTSSCRDRLPLEGQSLPLWLLSLAVIANKLITRHSSVIFGSKICKIMVDSFEL